MNTPSFLPTLIAAAGSLLIPAALHAHSLIHGLTATNSLVLFSTAPGPVVPGATLFGLGEGELAVSLDWRPLTGALYVLSRDANDVGRLYVVDSKTGAATAVDLSGAALTISGPVDMDFNPVAVSGINALRIVTETAQNYRLVFGDTGATVHVDGALNIGGGAGDARVVATAYSNNRGGQPGSGGAGGTIQYALDIAAGLLYRVNPPNNGTLVDGRPLDIDVTAAAGFDIATGSDQLLALLTVGGVSGLYEVNPATGAASRLRELPEGLVSMAVAPPAEFPPTQVYGLSDTNSLVLLMTDSELEGTPVPVTGLAEGVALVALDFRPFNGQLYALGRDGTGMGRLHTVDPLTGAAAEIALTGAPLLLEGSVGMDFNPVALAGVNALRIITGAGRNYRLVFNDPGAFVNQDRDMNTASAAGINVIATAYANNQAGLPGGGGAGGTVQYALDSATSSLYRVNPPNDGTLVNRLPLTLEVGDVGGLDIITGSDRALALLDSGGLRGIYELDLTHGTLQWIRSAGSRLVDLAVAVPITITGFTPDGPEAALAWSGGVGPFAVRRSDRLSDPFCGIAAVSTRSVVVSTDGNAGYFRISDLSGASSLPMTVDLSGAAERPSPVSTSATGYGTLEVTGGVLKFHISYRSLSGPATAAHLHGPADSSATAGVLLNLEAFNGGAFGSEGTLTGEVVLSPDLQAALLSSQTYINIHTEAHPNGELRGQVVAAAMKTALSGAAERPIPNDTRGTGFGLFSLIGRELIFQVSYRDLSGPVVAAHFHGPAPRSGTAGVLVDLEPFHAGSFGSEGLFSGRITLDPAGLSAFQDGAVYVNLHTSAFPGGELRGQVLPVLGERPFTAELTGRAERPEPVTTDGFGLVSASLHGDVLSFQIQYGRLSGPLQAAHIHGPAGTAGTAGVLVDLWPFHIGRPAEGGRFLGSVTLAPQQRAALLAGSLYINLHTASAPGGELRGQLTPLVLGVHLDGASERPDPVATSGLGQGWVGLIGSNLALGISYRGLSGPATAAHFHGPADANGTAGVLLDLQPFSEAVFGSSGLLRGSTVASDAVSAALRDGLIYVNIHTAAHGGGEIRGQVLP